MKNLKDIIYKYAKPTKIAQMLNITRSAVHQHITSGRIPHKYAFFYKALTNGEIKIEDIFKQK